MRRAILFSAILYFVTVFSLGCGKAGNRADDTVGSDAPLEPVVFLVAASAKDAVDELAEQFERKYGTRVNVIPGPTSTLAQQIIAGSPAHLFLSASQQWTDVFNKKGLIERWTLLLTNDLVIVVPKGNPAQVRTPADLASERVKHVALAGENVPAGMYAQQALLAHELFDKLADQNKIVRGGDVRITLSYVQRGEAEAGIVYSTDALMSQDVEVAHRFADSDHDKIIYPLVLLKTDNGPSLTLYYFLRSPAAIKVFEKHGFRQAGMTKPE